MQRSHFISTVAAVLIVVCSIWIAIAHMNQTPQHVFSDMLRNNLSTTGVTRVVTQTSQGLSVTQYNQLSLGARPIAHALTVFKQNGGSLTTEEVSTQASDYVRYRSIVTPSKTASGKPLNVSGIVGKWAKLQSGGSINSALASGLFNQSLTGILPLANLSSANRSTVLATIQHGQVFSYNAKAVKTTQLAGRKTYQYALSIKPEAYIIMMQQFEKLIGLSTYANVPPGQYASAQPITVQISIDARSHQLTQTYQASTGKTEQYVDFGTTDTVALPHATLTTTQLTQRLAALQ